MSYKPAEESQDGQVPVATYTLFAHDVVQKVSKKGNTMDQLKLEILAPLTAAMRNDDGTVVEVKVAKTPVMMFITYTNDKFFGGKVAGLKRLGFVPNAEYGSFEEYVAHIQSFTKQLKGLCFDATVSSEPEYAEEALTSEDIARGVKEKLRLDANNKPIIIGYRGRCEAGQIVGNLQAKENLNQF